MSDLDQTPQTDEPFDLEHAPLTRPRGFATDWGGDGADLTRPVRAHVLAALRPAAGPYAPPLDVLLTLGDIEDEVLDDCVAELGIGQEHIPELIRMLRDRSLATASGDTPKAWVPLHALHTLAGLDLSAHVAELIPIFDTDLDVTADQLIWTLGDVGAPAIAPLQAYTNDRTKWDGGRSRAANALEEIGKKFPATRDGIVASISAIVQSTEAEPEGLISMAIASLIELKAVEVLPVIRRAFELGKVDETVPGPWGEVLKDLDVEPDPDDPLIEESRRRFEERHRQMFPHGPYGQPRSARGQEQIATQKRKHEQARKEKNKRKAASASRKANRKKRK